MSYALRREENEHNHVRYFIYWEGNASRKDRFEVGMDQHFGMWIHGFDQFKGGAETDKLGYLYEDEAAKLVEALNLLMKEKEKRIKARQAEHDHWQRTCQDKTFHGASVDLSPAATFEALQGVEVKLTPRNKFGHLPMIKYKGRWMVFGRTDLINDVRTSFYVRSLDEAQEHVEAKASFNYGARLSEAHFSVVDSMTDG